MEVLITSSFPDAVTWSDAKVSSRKITFPSFKYDFNFRIILIIQVFLLARLKNREPEINSYWPGILTYRSAMCNDGCMYVCMLDIVCV